MKKKTLKKMGIFLAASVVLGSAIPAAAEGTEAEVTAAEATATEAAGDAASAAPDVPSAPAPIAGEKTEVSSGVIEKISTDIVVEEETKGSVESLVYTPSEIQPVGPTTPIFLVYGDTAFSEDAAEKTLVSSGLDVLAKEENCSVAFVNPVGETWGQEDADAYLYSLVDLWSEEVGSQTGKTADGSKFIGSTQRIYILADGAGADFVSQYLVKDTMKKFNIFADFYFVPTGVMLFNTSSTEAACTYGMPAVISGGSEALVQAYKDMNGTDGEEAAGQGTLYTNSISAVKNFMVTDTAEGFDKDILRLSWEQILSKTRRQLSGYTDPDSYELLPVYDYTEYGIAVNKECEAINGAKLEWYEYIPEDVSLEEEGSVPLMFTFHGGGNHAEYQAIASEWPLVAKENGFMVVSVNQHVDRSAEDIVTLLELLEDKYPAIDKTRIYASGFSMGSVKSWELGTKYPELFAGIAPMDAVIEPEWDLVDTIIPTYYVAGEEDGLLVFPHQAAFGGEGGEGNGDYIIQRLFEMNKVEYTGYDEKLNQLWGMEFDSTVEVPTANGLHVDTENYKKSEDGNTYTALVSMSNQAHAVLAGNSYNAWDFLKQFSRNEDGTISIAE